MKSAEERKQQSIALLKEQGVPYIEHLPVIETADDVRLRSAEEIARRAICCLITIQLACDLQDVYKRQPLPVSSFSFGMPNSRSRVPVAMITAGAV